MGRRRALEGSRRYGADGPAAARIAFRPARVSKLLGAEISVDEQRTLLRRVGVETELASSGARIQVSGDPKPLVIDPGSEQALVAIVPTWRRDLAIEADLAEEIARIRGYETRRRTCRTP